MSNHWRCLYCAKTYEQEGQFCPACHRLMTRETTENCNKSLLREVSPREEKEVAKPMAEAIEPKKEEKKAETKAKGLALSRRR